MRLSFAVSAWVWGRILLVAPPIGFLGAFAFHTHSQRHDWHARGTTWRHVTTALKDIPPSLSQQQPSSQHASPLSLTMEELSTILQGRGRAQIVWQLLRQGLDPYDGSSLIPMDDNDASKTDTLPMQDELKASQLPTLGQKAQKIYQRAFGNTGLTKSVANLIQTTIAADGTTKLLLRCAADTLEVETVIIPWDDRQRSTLCVSSQVGCKQGCTFCLTGKMGKLRSLSTDEILIQVAVANAVCRARNIYPIDNIVFMGMGEPADCHAVVPAARILTDREQFQLAPRRVTISTVAPSPDAFRVLGQAPSVLAWSVHAANDVLRRELVPTTKHTMAELRHGLIETLQSRSRRMRAIMLEVTLLDQINDTTQAALELADFCQPILEQVNAVKLVINLIPWNDISASFGPAAQYRQPTRERVEAFQRILVQQGLLCYVRTTRGDDESSACGQLATKKRKG